jgi:hypothetical protein
VAGAALMPGEQAKGLWIAITVIFGMLTSMVVFSTGLLLSRLDNLERQVAIGILPIATERLRAVEYRLDRIEERLNRIENRLQIKDKP